MVHILHQGRALCGQQGTPDQWPTDHWWVRLEQANEATCPECRRVVLDNLREQTLRAKKE